MTKQDVVNHILSDCSSVMASSGRASAPVNIALAKYWGKRDEELNLPVTSSLSISLGPHGTVTEIIPNPSGNAIFCNGEPMGEDTVFHRRLMNFLALFRPSQAGFFTVRTENSIPTAAGLASSSSGFAAATKALNQLFSWNLPDRTLSILARLGSGSASRSIFDGFVEWHAGSLADGMDSYAEPLPYVWHDLRIGLLTVSQAAKPISSREAMRQTVATSPLYRQWPEKVNGDLAILKRAIRDQEFALFGQTAESNALTMHATMIAAWPSICYWLPETVREMHRIWNLRRDGVPVYFTMDAGPNIKLLFLQETLATVQAAFPNAAIVAPFPTSPQPNT